MPKALKIITTILITTIAVAVLIVGGCRPGLLRGQPNDGHQLGGDLMDKVPCNTIESFVTAIEQLESESSYLYSECDVQETKDHQLVVFHDWDISSVPNTDENRKALGEPVESQPICELTLEQIQGLRLDCDCEIPTLECVLQKAAELNLKKPLLLEIKYLHSESARNELLEVATRYRDGSDVEIHFLAFIRNIKRSYSEPEDWLEKFAASGFRVYQIFRPKTKEYDLCENWN